MVKQARTHCRLCVELATGVVDLEVEVLSPPSLTQLWSDVITDLVLFDWDIRANKVAEASQQGVTLFGCSVHDLLELESDSIHNAVAGSRTGHGGSDLQLQRVARGLLGHKGSRWLLLFLCACDTERSEAAGGAEAPF